MYPLWNSVYLMWFFLNIYSWVWDCWFKVRRLEQQWSRTLSVLNRTRVQFSVLIFGGLSVRPPWIGPSFLSAAVIKHRPKPTWGGKSWLQLSVHHGGSEGRRQAGTEAETVEGHCLLPCSGSQFSCLFYTGKDHLPRGGSTHSSLGPPM